MSKLIKREENPFLKIESFKAEELCRDRKDEPSGNDNGCVRLPLHKSLSPYSINSSKNEKQERKAGEEENIKDKLAGLEKEAYEKGFDQGQKDGLALEKRQVEEKGKRLETLFTGLSNLKAQIYSETEAALLKMSMLIAKKIIREDTRINKGIIGNTIKSALEFLADKSNIRILINPDDMEEVRNLLPSLAAITKGGRFQLIEDNAIERGGSILETGFGKSNATIEDQLAVLEKEIEMEFKAHHGESNDSLA